MPIPRAYRNDRNAPWNQPTPPECPECQESIQHVEDHKEWCEFKESPEELHIYWEEQSYPQEPEERL